MKDKNTTHSLQVAMYYIAQVEIVKALCHVPQLRYSTSRRNGGGGGKFTHQANTIRLGVHSYVFSDDAISRPILNDLKWCYLGENSKERDDVRVV